jgi:hypothetical protein
MAPSVITVRAPGGVELSAMSPAARAPKPESAFEFAVRVFGADTRVIICRNAELDEYEPEEIIEDNEVYRYVIAYLNLEDCAAAGALMAAKWLQRYGKHWTKAATQMATQEGQLELLKWASAHMPGFGWDPDTSNTAARGGWSELLRWASAQPGFVWDPLTSCAAAAGGYLELLRWASAHISGFVWHPSTSFIAAQGGQLELLRWASAQPGFVWHPFTKKAAAKNGNPELIAWLEAHMP